MGHPPYCLTPGRGQKGDARGAALLLFVALFSQAAAVTLPDALPGGVALDQRSTGVNYASVMRNQAAEQGTECQDIRVYTYAQPAEISRGVGAWLAAQNLSASNTFEDGMTLAWRAAPTDPGRADRVLGRYARADVDSARGTLVLCAGALKSAVQQPKRREGRWLWGLAALALVGVGGVARRISGGVWGR